MSEQLAWSVPLCEVRGMFQELRLDPSLLSLATESSASRCPRRKSLFPSGKNLSIIGYLIGGAVPESQFTIVGFLLFSWCVSPAKTRSTVRKWLFFPAFLWSGDLRSFQCQCDYTARWHVSRQDREGTCFWIRNWQPNQIYLLRLSTEIWVDFFWGFGNRNLLALITITWLFVVMSLSSKNKFNRVSPFTSDVGYIIDNVGMSGKLTFVHPAAHCHNESVSGWFLVPSSAQTKDLH